MPAWAPPQPSTHPQAVPGEIWVSKYVQYLKNIKAWGEGGCPGQQFDCLVPQATGFAFHPGPAMVSQADHRKTANTLRFSDL